MIEHKLWLLLHVLLLVYWLGTDLAVFYASGRVLDRTQAPAARAMAARLMLAMDMVPRSAMPLMLAVGMTLAARVWWPSLQPFLVWIWLTTAIWLALAWASHLVKTEPAGRWVKRADTLLRVGVIAICLGYVIRHWGDAGAQHWLLLKLLIFALLIICGLAIRWFLRPFGPAFGQIVAGQGDANVEQQLTRSIALVKPFVLLIWLGLVVAAWLGISKTI